jgi:hypothetical protein
MERLGGCYGWIEETMVVVGSGHDCEDESDGHGRANQWPSALGALLRAVKKPPQKRAAGYGGSKQPLREVELFSMAVKGT